jgi:hypothetical protein
VGQKKHGPYLYAYWKEDNKTRSRYVGKDLHDFNSRVIAKEMNLRPSVLRKLRFIKQEASRGNVLAKEYSEKLTNREVSIDWAYRVIINHNRLKQKQDERIKFIISEMKKEGLDPDNEEDLLGYLNRPHITFC